MANGNGAGIEAREVGGALTSMRIDELISSLAIGIAQGQMELDRVCMAIAQFMSAAQVAFGKRAGSDEPDLMSLIELGFTPNFYQFVDTILEVRVAVSSRFEESTTTDVSQTQAHQQELASQSGFATQAGASGAASGSSSSWGWFGGSSGSFSSAFSKFASATGSTSSKTKNISVATVDAQYASKYNYSVEAASTIKTKIVPVPVPTVFDEVVRAKLKERRALEQRDRWRREARAALLSLSEGAGDLLADATALPSNVPAPGYKRSAAQALKDVVDGLRATYATLSNDHWAEAGRRDERQGMDAALETLTARVQTLRASFATPAPNSDDASQMDAGDLQELLLDARAKLTAFGATAAAIHARLTPPAPAA